MFTATSVTSAAEYQTQQKCRRWLPLLLICTFGHSAATYASSNDYQLTTIADNLNFPWSIAFLPNGDHLVTELGGNLLRISADGSSTVAIEGVPVVYRASQGGLFDVVLDPDFSQNRKIYLSYAAGDAEQNSTVVASARLSGNNLEGTEVLFSSAPKKYAPLHYGGRLAWLPDETLLLTTGDGFDFREQAQNLETHFGKTIRLSRDGTAPADNPFSNAPYVWSYGHRNPQGLAVSNSGVVFQHEHGPQGGDEVNIIEPGNNYGWPAITYGVDYNGAYVSPFTEFAGMQQPIKVWVPSIAPSGLMIYEGSMFPQWRGDLFVGALVDAEVRHLQMDNREVVEETVAFGEISERIRDIRQAPDGSIYVLTDGEGGSVIRVSTNQE
ncbi:MAG: PQQ-dependent sugar dehydrogenase [Pseudomonadaceae bacterium]|nr:PQQ-dependent sugar dehydrogenase [Pseudomonadaceae bacterium]